MIAFHMCLSIVLSSQWHNIALTANLIVRTFSLILSANISLSTWNQMHDLTLDHNSLLQILLFQIKAWLLFFLRTNKRCLYLPAPSPTYSNKLWIWKACFFLPVLKIIVFVVRLQLYYPLFMHTLLICDKVHFISQ